jgi:hypothetical protein
VNLPPEIFKQDLTDVEFRVLASLYHVANGRGIADISQEELGELTGRSRDTLRLAIRSLESRDLLQTTRKKRNFGKLHRNVYQLLVVPEYVSPCLTDKASTGLPAEESPCLTDKASTDDYIASSRLTTSSLLNTSYLVKVGYAHKPKREEPQMGKWNKSWDDDNLGSVGLFDEELLDKVPSAKINKRDPRTRNQRPEHDWTTLDTAAEYADRLRRKFPQLPSLVSTRNLSIILSKYRKELSTTALVELELIRIFFEDEKNLTYVARTPGKAMGAYLNLFKSRLSDALDRLDMAQPQRNTDTEVALDSDFTYASDGTKFENTLVGRKALQRHEERVASKS